MAKLVVTFKHEDEDRGMPFGPVKIIDMDRAEADGATMTPIGPNLPGRPYGSPEPDYIEDRGWLTKREAIDIAETLGAEFTES
jgi:hypothetical protein